jgi:hypothetical protein
MQETAFCSAPKRRKDRRENQPRSAKRKILNQLFIMQILRISHIATEARTDGAPSANGKRLTFLKSQS